MPCHVPASLVLVQGESRLQALWVDSNQFTGCVPASWQRLTLLEHLSLRDNRLACNLTDVIAPLVERELACTHFASPHEESDAVFAPRWDCGCSQLREMDVSMNALTGTIPQELVVFRSLSVLDVHANNLTGTLPVLLANFTQLGSWSVKRAPYGNHGLDDAARAGVREAGTGPGGGLGDGFGLNVLRPGNQFDLTLTPISLAVFRAHDNPGLTGCIPDSYGNLPYLNTLTVCVCRSVERGRSLLHVPWRCAISC